MAGGPSPRDPAALADFFPRGLGMDGLDCCHRGEEVVGMAVGRGDAGMDSDRLGRLIDRHAAALELYARK
jgi:hypothetical protein